MEYLPFINARGLRARYEKKVVLLGLFSEGGFNPFRGPEATFNRRSEYPRLD